MADGSVMGRELWPPPTDGITKLRFSDQSDHILVSSWDSVSASSFYLSLNLGHLVFWGVGCETRL